MAVNKYSRWPEHEELEILRAKHLRAGFDLPAIRTLASMRASFNFKAKKHGIDTHKWA